MRNGQRLLGWLCLVIAAVAGVGFSILALTGTRPVTYYAPNIFLTLGLVLLGFGQLSQQKQNGGRNLLFLVGSFLTVASTVVLLARDVMNF
jgi:hypothetical protein